jgi:NodT family efflux transporter outer membrane factor (OMF) lipoprotein
MTLWHRTRPPAGRWTGCELTALLGCALLGGCAVGPDFKPPASPQTDRYTAEPMPAQTAGGGAPVPSTESAAQPAAASPPDPSDVAAGGVQVFQNGANLPAQWWELFHSTRLNGLVEQAVRSNPDAAAAQAALREARENVLVQKGNYYPSVDLSGQAVRQKVSGAQFGQPGFSAMYTLFNASVDVSYTLDVWGGVRRGVEGVAAQAEYQNFQLEGTYLTLASNVVTAAIQQASLRAQLAATREIIAADRQQLDVVRQQFEFGAASRADVLTQQTLLAQEAANVPSLQKQMDQSRNLLAVLVGQLPSEPLDSEFDLTELQLPQNLPVTLPSALVEQRPDVRAQQALLHRASAQIGVATANMLPQFTLSGSYGGASTKLGDVLKSGSNVWSFGAGLTQPLFRGGALRHQRRAAIAAYDQAAAQYRSTVLKAFQNVADVLRALDADAEAVLAQREAEQTAAANLGLSRSQYGAGAISYLTLLTAQRSYQQTRIALLQAEAARYADTAALFQALGGGWWNRGQEKDSQ